MGKRLMIIRLIATVMIVLASYAVGWYIFSRFTQLEEPDDLVKEDELNNPRLNKNLLEDIRDEVSNRKFYSGNDEVSIEVEEQDPFYK